MHIIFIGFVLLMAALILVLTSVYLGRRTAVLAAAGLLPWLIYIGCMSYFGVIRNSTLPPGPILILLPAVVILILLFRYLWSRMGTLTALAFPLWVILATQCFRVGVEYFLHELWIAGIVPKMLTFEGANLDIYVGASAPLIAWVSTRGRLGLKAALWWNVLGIFILANVVGRAIVTAPGPFHFIHTETENLMFGTFPFTFIPGFFVPLALSLHLLAFRSITSRLAASASSDLNGEK